VPGIYLKQGDDGYVAMTETAYDAEKVLQRLIARVTRRCCRVTTPATGRSSSRAGKRASVG